MMKRLSRSYYWWFLAREGRVIVNVSLQSRKYERLSHRGFVYCTAQSCFSCGTSHPTSEYKIVVSAGVLKCELPDRHRESAAAAFQQLRRQFCEGWRKAAGAFSPVLVVYYWVEWTRQFYISFSFWPCALPSFQEVSNLWYSPATVLARVV